jgi:hypothetical protein
MRLSNEMRNVTAGLPTKIDIAKAGRVPNSCWINTFLSAWATPPFSQSLRKIVDTGHPWVGFVAARFTLRA